MAAAEEPGILADQVAQTEVLETHNEGQQSDPSPRWRASTDCQRFTAGEIAHLIEAGWEVWSDAEVNRLPQQFIDSLEPSIDDYLPRCEIEGTLTFLWSQSVLMNGMESVDSIELPYYKLLKTPCYSEYLLR